jgi:O-acetyl-ADP-ribose deacetylase (regulator of RNase III)
MIALKAVKSFLETHPAAFEKILFVLFSDRDLEIYTRTHSEIFR